MTESCGTVDCPRGDDNTDSKIAVGIFPKRIPKSLPRSIERVSSLPFVARKPRFYFDQNESWAKHTFTIRLYPYRPTVWSAESLCGPLKAADSTDF